MSIPNCPNCNSEYGYEDGSVFVCPECNHEWNELSQADSAIRDAHGNILTEGDSVVVVKDLKVKGASNSLKQGTIIKGIRFNDGAENVSCKVDGFGSLFLKSEYLKKL